MHSFYNEMSTKDLLNCFCSLLCCGSVTNISCTGVHNRRGSEMNLNVLSVGRNNAGSLVTTHIGITKFYSG